MTVTTLIGGRYYRSRSTNRFVSLVTLVSFFGLVLGVATLIVVVSVMNGFDKELKQRILGVVPHVVVQGIAPQAFQDRVPALSARSESATPFKRVEVLLLTRNGTHLMSLQGIDPELEPQTNRLVATAGRATIEKLSNSSLNILVGQAIANRFGLQVGDRVNLVLPRITPGGENISPVLLAATIAGDFSVGSELDYRVAVTHIDQAVQISGQPADLRLTLNDLFAAPPMAASLRQAGLSATSWDDEFGDFFRTVRMEKVMMFVLLTFVIAIASFSIVSGLTMMVASKKRDIAVLRTMGMTERGVLQVFLVQGLGIAAIGVLIGVVVGILLANYAPAAMALVEELTGFSIVAGTYFDQIPIDIRWPDIVMIAIVTFAISFGATLYPSFRAARLNPAAVLRYE